MLLFSLPLNSVVLSKNYKPGLVFTKDCVRNNKQYYVKKVFDGDTILITNISSGQKKEYEKIRFLGIDAFEYEQNKYGFSGKDFLSKLLLNQNVCVETDINEKDQYGRTLGYVFLMSANIKKYLFVNEEILKSGNAIIYNFPPNIKYIDRLKKAQIYARNNMVGVWEKQNIVLETPAQWRHKHPHHFYKKEQNKK